MNQILVKLICGEKIFLSTDKIFHKFIKDTVINEGIFFENIYIPLTNISYIKVVEN